MINMEIGFSWKAVASGVILTGALEPVFRFITPEISGLMSIVVASISGGYIADVHYLKGVFNGALIGASVGMINILLVYIRTWQMNTFIIMILIYALAGDISLGILGGTAGSLLRTLNPRLSMGRPS